MKYQIKVNYDTGNSFHNEYGVETFVEDITWSDLDVAKENLKRLEEHYKFVKAEDNTWRPRKCCEFKKIVEESKTKDWYSSSYPQFTVILKEDNGDDKITHTGAWCGYFESVNHMEIELIEDEERRIDFK
jgi:hypothetical protein